MKYLIILILFFLACDTGGKADDTATTSSVSEANPCTFNTPATSAEEAMEQAEQQTGMEAVAVEELEQEGALRMFRVSLKDVTFNVNGCNNHVTFEEHEISTNVETEAP